MTKRSPELAPTHPGELLREIVLPALTLSKVEIASRLGISRQNLYALINCEIAVSPEMASRLGRFFGNGPELWLDMQTDYDLWHVAQDSVVELEAIEPVTEAEQSAAQTGM